MRNKTYKNGKLICEDYYIAGGHTYEFPQSRGKRRSTVTYREAPTGDAQVIEDRGGSAYMHLLEEE